MVRRLSNRPPAKPAASTTRTSAREAAGQALYELIWEIPFTYFRLNRAGYRWSAPAGQSPGKISLLRSLAMEGPQSVAQIAHSRPVSRQGVQQTADQLAADGLVEYFVNPTHRRAKLVRITPAGEKILRQMLARQRRMAIEMAKGFDERALKSAVAVLREFRERLLKEESAE